jgi:hypothetical protein
MSAAAAPPDVGGAPVSFWKAEQLLSLATLVAARHSGVTLDDVIERFGVSKRTAQRMLRALEAQFPDTHVTSADEGRKRWHLPSGALRDCSRRFWTGARFALPRASLFSFKGSADGPP